MLIDANLLIYAHDETSPQHELALPWLEARLNGPYRVGIPWPSILAFLRLTTNPRVSATPSSPAEAWGHVESWFASGAAWIPMPTERHREILGELVVGLHVTANLVSDAHLAALAMEHGLLLCSADSDFARFPGLRWLNPIVG